MKQYYLNNVDKNNQLSTIPADKLKNMINTANETIKLLNNNEVELNKVPQEDSLVWRIIMGGVIGACTTVSSIVAYCQFGAIAPAVYGGVVTLSFSLLTATLLYISKVETTNKKYAKILAEQKKLCEQLLNDGFSVSEKEIGK